MYFIYQLDVENNITICAHSKLRITARELLIKSVHGFIGEQEGIKKISERELKSMPTNIDEMDAGYWWIITDKEFVEVYKKTFKKVPGLVFDGYQHDFKLTCRYSITSYDNVTSGSSSVPIIPILPESKTTPVEQSIQQKMILEELRRSPFFLRVQQACIVVPDE